MRRLLDQAFTKHSNHSNLNARRCIEDKCFEGDETVADLVVFTSVPVIWDWIYNIFHAAVYSKTGRSLFPNIEIPTDGGWVPEKIPALQVGGCASCFQCKARCAALVCVVRL